MIHCRTFGKRCVFLSLSLGGADSVSRMPRFPPDARPPGFPQSLVRPPVRSALDTRRPRQATPHLCLAPRQREKVRPPWPAQFYCTKIFPGLFGSRLIRRVIGNFTTLSLMRNATDFKMELLSVQERVSHSVDRASKYYIWNGFDEG